MSQSHNPSMELDGKKVLVIGAGRSGVASARFLNARGALVVLNDRKEFIDWPNDALALKNEGVVKLLAVTIGGLFVLIVSSVVIQVGSFKLTGKRVFKMTPLHHHFELSGWGEVTIVIRFWLIAGLFAGIGMGIFYAEWVVS